MKALKKFTSGLLLSALLFSCEPCSADDKNDLIILDLLTEVAEKLKDPIDREGQLIIADMIRTAVEACKSEHLKYHEKTFSEYGNIVAFYEGIKKKKKTGIASGPP